jgi:hypothetical protein
MNTTKKLYTVTLIFIFGLLFSQKQKELTQNAASTEILSVSKTVFTGNDRVPVNIINAHYDAKKKNIPFLTETKITDGAGADGSLINIKTVQLSSEVSSKLISYFKNYLTDQFQTEIKYLQSGRDKMACLRVIPYRLTPSNTVEELISFEVNWKIKPNEQVLKTTSTYSNVFTSVLGNGKWYKIGLTKTGVYKLDRNFLSSMGMDVSTINPQHIRIYGNGGHMIPEANSAFRFDDLMQNRIQVIGESDGVMNTGDYVLFYGQSADQWIFDKNHSISCLNFSHQWNYYSDTSYYFITTDLGPGIRIQDRPALAGPATNTVTTYDYYDVHEQNSINFIKSGREFYGEDFDANGSYSFIYNLSNLVVGDTVAAYANVAARGASPSTYNISFSGSSSTFTMNSVNVNDYLYDYVDIGTSCTKVLCNNPSFLSFALTKLTPANSGWLDKLEFNCRRYLSFGTTQYSFRDCRSYGLGKTSQFVINAGSLSNLSVWDVTDPLSPQNQLYNSGTGQLDFVCANDSLHEFIAFNGSDFYTPTFVKKIANQNLHNLDQADFIIVTYPGYLAEAQRLAMIHEQQDSLATVVVTTDEIYNEFSSGTPDISAIRDFTRMLYYRGLPGGKEVKYLLLFGDGSYKVKDRYGNGNTSQVPVYEVGVPKTNAYSPTLSTVSDDFYGWMDSFEGDDWSDGLVDIGIGRFPVKNNTEAAAAVNKVEAYYRKNYNFTLNEPESSCIATTGYPLGDWRNWICFIADDEDYQTHMNDAENLATKVKNNHPEYNIDKIYADAFLQYSTPGGERYPDVNSEIDHRVNKGSLVLNYTGHGGEVGLGHERLLEISQIQSYKNINNMPLFVTATCEFARFDDPDRTSAGELCFLNPDGAAIALLTTVRLAYSNTNFTLNSCMYDFIFDTLPNGKMPALGDVVKLTKRKSTVSFYYLNFHLLGDPALKLAYPKHTINTTQINNKIITTTTYDTLRALAKVTVKGYLADHKTGAKMTGFNGILYPTVFDKQQKITCLGNNPESVTSSGPFQFFLQKNVIYRGKVQVSNGDFNFSFIVPKDISYNFDLGKLSYYAHDGIVDAKGFNTNFYVGGSATNATPDVDGPGIGLYLNDKKFVPGGTTDETPHLYAEVIDSSGINTVGTGIGHDISAVLDGNSSKPILLNDYYEADLNSYQKGKIKYPFNELSEGNHSLRLKVWDVQNNSSLVQTDFVVAKKAEMALTHVLNYPNPFTSRTKFFFENNQCCTNVKVNVQIFTISGKVVKTINQTVQMEGFRSDGIDWDGKDEFGDKLAKGVYIYKLSISDAENKKAEKIEKLVILN